MQRVTRDKTIPVNRRYNIHEPVLEVELDESFLVETINFRTPIIRTSADANPKEYREREETGPIHINGIDVGDVLAIHIEAIKPEGHASGLWWNNPNVNSFLKIGNNKVYFPGGLWALQHMMIGDIYVTPAKGWDSVGGNPWDNGGNMDFKDVAPGNTLFLRSELKGGLLVLGDVHACQGDGELAGLGAECAATVQIRITKDTTFLPERPMIKKSNSFVAIACRRDYGEAWKLAARDASRILSHIAGVTENEAYLYCMTIGNLRNGAIWPIGTKDFRTKFGWGPPPLVVGIEIPLHHKLARAR